MANRVYGYQNYRGYQYETSPKKLQPEFEPNKKQKKNNNYDIKKTKKETYKSYTYRPKVSKEELKRKSTFVTYIIFGFAVLFTISYRNSIINEKFNEKEALKTELADIKKVNEQLEVSVESELNLTSIEKIAKESIGMSKLSNDQKIYVSLPRREYVESNVESIVMNQQESFYHKIYNKIIEFFN